MFNEENVKSQETSKRERQIVSVLKPISVMPANFPLPFRYLPLNYNTRPVYHPVICKGRLSSRSRGPTERREIYVDIISAYFFFPLAFETMGPINGAGQDLVHQSWAIESRT
jgi:hypothetical protein